eukprot:8403007-Pyramimonas_sp.AAC.1
MPAAGADTCCHTGAGRGVASRWRSVPLRNPRASGAAGYRTGHIASRVSPMQAVTIRAPV